MSVTPLPRRPRPEPALHILQTTDAIEVRRGDETGRLLACAERDPETLIWHVTINRPFMGMPGADREVFIVPTLRAVLAIVTDPDLIPILR